MTDDDRKAAIEDVRAAWRALVRELDKLDNKPAGALQRKRRAAAAAMAHLADVYGIPWGT